MKEATMRGLGVGLEDIKIRTLDGPEIGYRMHGYPLRDRGVAHTGLNPITD
jgi:hypothetical protein